MDKTQLELSDEVKSQVIACVGRVFGYGHSADIIRDADDLDVFYVKVYDVPEQLYQELRRQMVLALRSILMSREDIVLIPSLVSHVQTQRYFPSKVARPLYRPADALIWQVPLETEGSRSCLAACYRDCEGDRLVASAFVKPRQVADEQLEVRCEAA